MRALRRMSFALFCLFAMTGCTSLHYGWAYTQLHDAKGGDFQKPQGEVLYRELDSIEAMAEAERDMYRQGYVMIGYSNMISPQLEAIAPSGARQLAGRYGASAVLHTFGNRHYLATLWAKPKRFVFGAYYTDDLPEEARAALRDILQVEQGVIVQTVVEDSPAFRARVRPGDLLISLDDERIQDVATLNALLREHAGTEVTFIVWSMEEGPPRPVSVALASPEN